MAVLPNSSSRLWLLNQTGLQQKDPKLYQYLKDLLIDIVQTQAVVKVIEDDGGSGGNTTNVVNNNYNQFLNLLGDDGGSDDGLMVIPGPPGPAGAAGSPGIVTTISIPIQGLDGDQGEDAFPIPGPQGLQGNTGATGPPGSGGTVIIAESDESDANDTLHDDAEFLFAVGVNEKYLIEGVLFFTSGASNTPDCKFGWSFPANATLTVESFGPTAAATTIAATQWVAGFQMTTPSTPFPHGVLTSATAGVTPIRFSCILITTDTSGSLQLQWAQNVTTAGTPTVRKKDSWLRYTLVA